MVAIKPIKPILQNYYWVNLERRKEMTPRTEEDTINSKKKKWVWEETIKLALVQFKYN